MEIHRPPGIAETISAAVARKVRDEVAAEIQRERDYQDEKWGGPEGDDKRTPAEFAGYIMEYLLASTERAARHDIRTRLVKVSALAAAAVEAMDRRTFGEGKKPPRQSPPLR